MSLNDFDAIIDCAVRELSSDSSPSSILVSVLTLSRTAHDFLTFEEDISLYKVLLFSIFRPTCPLLKVLSLFFVSLTKEWSFSI